MATNKPDPFGRTLPADHRCRTDDLTYSTVTDWYDDHAGRVPLEVPRALAANMKARGCSFAEAFAMLTGPSGPVILIEDEEQRSSIQRPRR
jgi:hypothetical protein